jgi:hypothetical protein
MPSLSVFLMCRSWCRSRRRDRHVARKSYTLCALRRSLLSTPDDCPIGLLFALQSDFVLALVLLANVIPHGRLSKISEERSWVIAVRFLFVLRSFVQLALRASLIVAYYKVFDFFA